MARVVPNQSPYTSRFLSVPPCFSVRQFLQSAITNSHTNERLNLILLNEAMVFTSVRGPSARIASGRCDGPDRVSVRRSWGRSPLGRKENWR